MVGKTAGGNAAFHNFHNDYVHIEDPNERKYPKTRNCPLPNKT